MNGSEWRGRVHLAHTREIFQQGYLHEICQPTYGNITKKEKRNLNIIIIDEKEKERRSNPD